MDRPLEEVELVTRAQRGDAQAYGELVELHQTIAFRAAWTITRSAEEAEEAAQDGFVKAYRALGRFRAGAEFRPWLLRIVAHETSNAQRSRRRRAVRERSPAAVPDGALPGVAAAGDPAELAVAGERQVELRRVLLELPEAQRRVVVCRFLLDMDEAETGIVLGLARGTVKSRTHRGLRRMRALLDGGSRQEARQETRQETRQGEEAGRG